MGYRIDEVLMLFSIYSVLGWCINMCVYYLIEKRIDRRSICRGPYSAAFGIGAVAMIICNVATPKYISAIFGVGVVAGVVVQATAALVIRVLSGKWLIAHKWYLIPLFGIANVLLFYQVQPFIGTVLGRVSPWIKLVILLVFWMSFIPDLIDGICKMIDFKKKKNNVTGESVNVKV